MCLLELCLYLPRPIFAQCAITNEVTDFVERFKGQDEPKLHIKIQFVPCSEDILIGKCSIGAIITVCSEGHTKHTSRLYWQNVQFGKFKPGGM